MGTLQLGVNVDHIATLRQVRYATTPDSKNAEPDPVVAASSASARGRGITAHLRSDRRHVQERDLKRLRANIMTKLNLEMGNTPELIDFALLLQPDEVCLVPEKRQEITTEGGLDLVRHERDLGPTMKRLHAAGIRVSLFIDPAPEQVDTAVRLGSDMVELHTGGLANSFTEKVEQQELERLRAAAVRAANSGLQVMPGTNHYAISFRSITSRISLS